MSFNFAQVPIRAPRAARRTIQLGPCRFPGGCKELRLAGETTCFKHLDMEELERAISEPDDEGLDTHAPQLEVITTVPRVEEVAPLAAQEETEMVKKDETFTCSKGCGRDLTSPGRRAQHEFKCKGKVATSGQIDARAGTKEIEKVALTARRAAPSTKRAGRRPKRARPVSRPKAREQKRTRDTITLPIPQGIVAGVVERAVAELRKYRAEIDKAIAAIEALG